MRWWVALVLSWTVLLRVAASDAAITATPSPLRIGSTGVGIKVQRDLTIDNPGATVSVQGATITMGGTEFSLDAAPAFPAQVSTDGQVILTIGFNPGVTGLRSGELTITTSDGANPTLKVPLIGTSGPPAISLDAATVVLATTNVGASSAQTLVTITNVGFSNLDVTALTLGGTNPGDFTLDPKSFPRALPPGDSGKFGITFSPTMTGSRGATVTVVSNDGSAPAKVVALLGTGTSSVLEVTPASLTFGAITIGQMATEQTVTIKNASGNGTLKVSDVTIDGAQATSFTRTSGNAPPFSLAVPTSVTLGYVCAPVASGPLSASITVKTDIGNKTVPLSCEGVDPDAGSTDSADVASPDVVEAAATDAGIADAAAADVAAAEADAFSADSADVLNDRSSSPDAAEAASPMPDAASAADQAAPLEASSAARDAVAEEPAMGMPREDGAASPNHDGGVPNIAPASEEEGGCGCRLGSSSGPGGTSVWMLVALACLARRRRASLGRAIDRK